MHAQLEEQKRQYVAECERRHGSFNTENSIVSESAGDGYSGDSVSREVIAQRDKLIKAEIRKLQSEITAYEREIKSKSAEECKRIQLATESESQQLRRSYERLQIDIGELTTYKGQLTKEFKSLFEEINELQRQLSEYRVKHKTIVDAHKADSERVKKYRSDVNEREQREKMRFDKQLSSLNGDIELISDRIAKENMRFEQELADLERSHESLLEELNVKVCERIKQCTSYRQ